MQASRRRAQRQASLVLPPRRQQTLQQRSQLQRRRLHRQDLHSQRWAGSTQARGVQKHRCMTLPAAPLEQEARACRGSTWCKGASTCLAHHPPDVSALDCTAVPLMPTVMAYITCRALQISNARQIVWNAPHKLVASVAPAAAAAAPAEEAAENGTKPDKEEEAKPRAAGAADEAMAARAKRCSPRRPNAAMAS